MVEVCLLGFPELRLFCCVVVDCCVKPPEFPACFTVSVVLVVLQPLLVQDPDGAPNAVVAARTPSTPTTGVGLCLCGEIGGHDVSRGR